MSDSAGDPLRDAAQDVIRSVRAFLEAAEQALDDDERLAEWTARGQEVVASFLAGFQSGDDPGEGPDDGTGGIERIPLD